MGSSESSTEYGPIHPWSSIITQVAKSPTPAAQYVAKYAEPDYLWDELAAVAWLDPAIITKSQKLYIDVNTSHGAGYGDTLAWAPARQPGMGCTEPEWLRTRRLIRSCLCVANP